MPRLRQWHDMHPVRLVLSVYLLKNIVVQCLMVLVVSLRVLLSFLLAPSHESCGSG